MGLLCGYPQQGGPGELDAGRSRPRQLRAAVGAAGREWFAAEPALVEADRRSHLRHTGGRRGLRVREGRAGDGRCTGGWSGLPIRRFISGVTFSVWDLAVYE